MTYQLGIDLGTTYTAAAVCRTGPSGPSSAAEPVNLGTGAPTVPSVLYVGPDGSILVGDAAERRAITEPDRVVREFKRRIGDETPYIVGGREYRAHELAALLVRWVTDRVAERAGGPASGITLTHPASWRSHRKELLGQALERIGRRVTFLAEPQAAAVSYASAERVAPGSTIAVYDLGGGTFDAAVVRKNGMFTLLGEPEGIERLGGLDFDDLIFTQIQAQIGQEQWEAFDETDPNVISAVAQLRRECVEAKIALSTDTEVAIPVLLPKIRGQVKLTRGEFEGMIRGPLESTLRALHRTIASAGLTPADLSAVLLVGGSSRIPVVGELIANDIGRPLALDVDPQLAIALGAALSAFAPTVQPSAGPAPAGAPPEGTSPVGIPPAGSAAAGPAPVGIPTGAPGGYPSPPTAYPGPPTGYPDPPAGYGFAPPQPPGPSYPLGPPSGPIFVPPAQPPPGPGTPVGGTPGPGTPVGGTPGPGTPQGGTPGPMSGPIPVSTTHGAPPRPEGVPSAPRAAKRRGGRIALIVVSLAIVVGIGAIAAVLLLWQPTGDSGGGAAPAVLATIMVGGAPDGVAIAPDGARAYVTDNSAGKVHVIDTVANTVLTDISIPSPVGVAITPDGRRLYVVNLGTDTVTVIDTATNAVTGQIAVGKGPVRVAVAANGTQTYVTNRDSGTVSVIDVAANAVTATIRIADRPDHPTLTPDNKRLYVTSPARDQVSVIDIEKNALISTFPVSGGPFTVAFSPDGRQGYVTNNAGGTVSLFDPTSHAITGTIPVGVKPVRVTVTPDGRRIFVTNVGANTVSTFQSSSTGPSEAIAVGNSPSDAAVSADGRLLLVTNAGAGSISVVGTGSP